MANKFYAVKKGRSTGIFHSWNETQAAVKGYPDAKYQAFKTQDEATKFMQQSVQDAVPTSSGANSSAKTYYAVKKGRSTGVFDTWSATQKAVQHYPHADYKSFKTASAAQHYLETKPTLTEQQRVTMATNRSGKSTPHFMTKPDAKQFDVVMYTDGGCRLAHNRKGASINANDLSAWAYDINTHGHEYRGSQAYHGFTNNQMELSAMIWGLKTMKQHGLQNDRVLMVSDSHYALDPIVDGRLNQWAQQGWQKPLKNKEYWQTLHRELQDFTQLQFHWTKGHATNLGNNYVDHLLNHSMDDLQWGVQQDAGSPLHDVDGKPLARHKVAKSSPHQDLLKDLDKITKSSTMDKSWADDDGPQL